MSLQLAAQHLASRGRGPDTTLVHMAPQEVAGLQALAKAHGGTLTTNPDTGLPEAGFLSSILPMVAGAFLGPAGLGLTAMQAGLAGAALGTVATGSLQRGLMAGLGAYGGAGLAGSIMGAGTGALSSAAGAALPSTVTPAVAAEAVAPVVDITSGMADVAATEGFGVAGANFPTAGAYYGPSYGVEGLTAVPPTEAASMVPTVTQAPPPMSKEATDLLNYHAQENAAQQAVADKLAGASKWDTAKAGFGKLMDNPSQFMTKENLRYGLAGLAPVAMDMMTPKQREMAKQEERKPYMYAYEPGRATNPQQGYTGAFTGERTYFNPVYTRTAAGGGLMDIGPVEAMSRSNQSQMAPAYARGGVSDMAVNPYTGAETFAEGGDTKAVRRVEDDPYYTMSGQSGDAFKYLMGQTPITPRTPAPAPAAVTPVQSTVQPVAPETNSAMGVVGRLLGNTVFGAAFGKQPGQGGEYVDADTNVKPYSFDPVTGAFTAVAPKKVFRPYTAEPAPVYTGDTSFHGGFAQGGIASLAQGGQSHLGDYSDGGRLLRGPGDGVSDDIPATIGDKRPARLADGEFVVPARIVSELGNGSTEAGARKLYAMMDRVQKARGKTVGKDRVAVNTKAEKMLPA